MGRDHERTVHLDVPQALDRGDHRLAIQRLEAHHAQEVPGVARRTLDRP
jgi:hypothetical protein